MTPSHEVHAIRPLIAHQVINVDPRMSLAEAARKIHAGGVGSAVVMSDQGPGIITERDLLRAVAEGADLKQARVEDFVTGNAVTASPDLDVREAARLMTQQRFRHLVVVGPHAEVEGILSMRDVVAAMLEILEPASAAR
jgi:CBS domain-containing protein